MLQYQFVLLVSTRIMPFLACKPFYNLIQFKYMSYFLILSSFKVVNGLDTLMPVLKMNPLSLELDMVDK